MPILMTYNRKLAFDLPCLLLSAIAAHSLFKVGQKIPMFMLNSSLPEYPRVEGLQVHYRIVLLLFIGLLLGSININAATCKVNNSGNWSNSNTWTNCNGSVPSINDTVNMSSSGKIVTLTANAYASSITFNNSTAQLSLSSYTLTVTGSVTMPGGGVFNLNSGTLNVGGDFYSSSNGDHGSNGILSSGTGTINFNGNVAQNIGANTYNNVIINNSSGGVALDGAVTVGGTLTLSSATLSVGSNTLRLNGPTIAGTPANLSTTGSSSLSFGGSSTGIIVPSSVSALANLTVDNSNGVTLGSSLVLSRKLTLKSGNITTGVYSIKTSRNCPDSISRTSGYVIGNLNLTYLGNSGGTTTCTYDVGDSTGYAPITIAMSNVTVAGTVTGKVFAGDHPDTTSSVSGIDVAKSANHYWTLVAGTTSPTYSSYSATLQFCANTSSSSCTTNDVDSSATASSFVVAEKVSGIWSMLTVGTKLAYSTQATGITHFGEFSVGQSRTNALLHHIQIIQGGSACTSSPVTITVKACADAACTTLYNSSVTASLTATNTGVLSSSNITFSGGQATVTFTDTTPSTDVLGGSATSATNPTTCTNSAGGTSCSITVADCLFDVVEVGANASSPIYTKLANTAFNLDVLSLSSNPQTLTTPFIELVDMNTGTCATALALSSSSVTITPTLSGIANFSANQRKTLNFTYNNAAPNVRVRVTSSSVVSCSLDNFAVRPGALTMTTSANAASPLVSDTPTINTPTIKAGNNFTISAATSTSATDTYTGILSVDTSKLTVQETGVLGSLTSFKPDSTELTPTAVLANSTTTMSYSDVGYVYASAGAFRDDSFTSIDQPNDCISSTEADANLAVSLSGNKYGCSIGNQSPITFGRFIPDHFTVVAAVSNECPSGGFTYMGQTFSSFTDSSLVESRNSSNSVTQNYQPPYAPGTIVLGAENADNGTNLASRLDTFTLDPILNTFTSVAGTWSSGSYNITTNTTGTFSRPSTTTADWGSFDSLDIGLKVVDPDVTIVIMNADMNPDKKNSDVGGSTFTYKKFTVSPIVMRYGRIALQNASGSELLDLAMPMTAQYWNGTAWVTNTADQCTSETSLAATQVTGPISSICAYDTGSPGDSELGCATAGTSTNQFSNPPVLGDFNLNLKAPGSGNTGTMRITATVPGYLQYNWVGTGNAGPTANATFGIYTGNKNFIYLRELY